MTNREIIFLSEFDRKADKFYYRYLRADKYDIYQAYTKPSRYKLLAFQECIKIMNNKIGGRGRIISYNSNCFTFAFVYNTYKNTQVLVVLTKTKMYLIEYNHINFEI